MTRIAKNLTAAFVYVALLHTYSKSLELKPPGLPMADDLWVKSRRACTGLQRLKLTHIGLRGEIPEWKMS